MPWYVYAAGWIVLIWIAAPLLGRFFGLNDRGHQAPPAGPRTRFVLDRDRAGHVEIKPTGRRGA